MNRSRYRQAGRIVRDQAPRNPLRGGRSDRFHAVLLLAAGLAVHFGTTFISFDPGSSPTTLWWTLHIVSAGLWLYGCYFYTRALRLHPAWILFGLLSIAGVILMFLVSRFQNNPNRSRS